MTPEAWVPKKKKVGKRYLSYQSHLKLIVTLNTANVYLMGAYFYSWQLTLKTTFLQSINAPL